MDLKQLRLFRGVVDAGSFTKAAQVLHIAQPALGLQIKHLEDVLGVQLLVRHSRGVTPTEAGQLLYEHAEALLRQFDKVRQDMHDFAGAPRGRVALGLPPSVSIALAGQLVETVRRAHPAVTLSLAEGLSEWLVEWAEEERLDVAVSYTCDRDRILTYEPLAEERLYLVGRPDGIAGEPGPITLATMVACDLIVPTPPHGLRAIINEAADRYGHTLRIACEADGVHAIKDLVARGLGHAILPLCAIQRDLADGRLAARHLTNPDLHRTLFLAFLNRRPMSKALEVVCGEIRSAIDTAIGDGTIGWTRPRPRQLRLTAA